jgi:hypothetical protein
MLYGVSVAGDEKGRRSTLPMRPKSVARLKMLGEARAGWDML